jgi:hypothetical protein
MDGVNFQPRISADCLPREEPLASREVDWETLQSPVDVVVKGNIHDALTGTLKLSSSP